MVRKDMKRLHKEEYLVAKDMGGFYRVPADTRDLNYEIF